ncbi:MAG TPA: hypothetical protein VMT89_12815, partial [Candidatus Acidoferrales bacterium]|nr:hypothetical protein [Candidatus Acidoferrales bacterium]
MIRKTIVAIVAVLGVGLAVPHLALALGLRGNCGDTSHGDGCNVDACASCVCDGDTFCCETDWDIVCAGEAAEFCASDCFDGTFVGDCGVSESEELILRSGGADTSQAADVKLGCSDSDCSGCVCDANSDCCAELYDSGCVGTAATTCSDACLEEAGAPGVGATAQAPTLSGSMLLLLSVVLAGFGCASLGMR